MIEVIDNALPESIFKKLSNQAIHANFPWRLSNDIEPSYLDTQEENPGICKDNNSISSYQFEHIFYNTTNETKIRSPFFNLFNKAIFDFLENKNMTGVLFKSKLNLLTNLHKIKDNKLYNIPHVDLNIPHFSVLLYLNDSDGDTIFFNERNDGKETITKSVSIKERISPKKNRMVLSNGNFHTSTNPINTDYRIVYNAVVLI